MTVHSGGDATVQLSVIVLVHNRDAPPTACLRALSQISRQQDRLDVIVVSRHARLDLDSIMPEGDVPSNIRQLAGYQDSWGTLLIRAVEISTATHCLFLDGRVVPSPQLVYEHLSAQRRRGGVVALGAVPPPYSSDPGQSWQGTPYPQTALGDGQEDAPFRPCPWGNVSLPRAAIMGVQGFQSDPIHDPLTDLAFRAVMDGLQPCVLPETPFRWAEPWTRHELITRAAWDGAAAVELYSRHPSILSHLDLGAFSQVPPRAAVLRRILLRWRIPPAIIAVLGRVLEGHSAWRAWYQFLYGYGYWYGVRKALTHHETWQRLTRPPVILMYHAVCEPGTPPHRYILPQRAFARQMAWLRFRRYTVIPLSAFLRDRRDRRLPPARSVILTFDDGYRDNWTLAEPILRTYGFGATVFVVSGALGGVNTWDDEGPLAGRRLVSTADVRAMGSGRLEIGAHTIHHVRLPAQSPECITDEVCRSRRQLEQALEREILSFAYPHGAFDERARSAVRQARYLGACTVQSGANDPGVPNDLLNRIEIRGTDSLLDFVLAVWLGKSHVLSRLRFGR